jgi:hypothetical protein
LAAVTGRGPPYSGNSEFSDDTALAMMGLLPYALKWTSRATAIQYSSPASCAARALSKRGAGGWVISCVSAPSSSKARPACGLVNSTRAVPDGRSPRMISSKSADARQGRVRG